MDYLLITILWVHIFTSRLPRMAPVAQGLPVASVPEQFHITTVWDYVVHIRRLHVPAFLPLIASDYVYHIWIVYTLSQLPPFLPLIAPDHVYHIWMVYTISQLPVLLPLIAADHVYHICMVHILSLLPTFCRWLRQIMCIISAWYIPSHNFRRFCRSSQPIMCNISE